MCSSALNSLHCLILSLVFLLFFENPLSYRHAISDISISVVIGRLLLSSITGVSVHVVATWVLESLKRVLHHNYMYSCKWKCDSQEDQAHTEPPEVSQTAATLRLHKTLKGWISTVLYNTFWRSDIIFADPLSWWNKENKWLDWLNQVMVWAWRT